jgi:excisionase family DNA binding protein
MSKQAYLTSRQVADMTGISLDTLARWRCRKQRIPYLKIGRAVRYERIEVLAYLERCRVPVSGSYRE